MGTSSIFRGNNDRNPLLPSDYEEQGRDQVQSVTWKTVKTDMSKYITSEGTHGSAGHIIRQAIRANGGAKRMIANSPSSIRAAKSIGRFFAGIRVDGIYVTLQQLGIQYEGRSVAEIFSHLINVIAPAADTKEDIVARKASQAAICNMYEYVADNNMDFSCMDKMPSDVMDHAMKSFLTEYIWASIMKDLECRIEQYMAGATSACEREKELKDIIEAVVDVEYDNHGTLINADINDAVSTLSERCLMVLEGIV